MLSDPKYRRRPTYWGTLLPVYLSVGISGIFMFLMILNYGTANCIQQLINLVQGRPTDEYVWILVTCYGILVSGVIWTGINLILKTTAK